jgi:hypothetical protein
MNRETVEDASILKNAGARTLARDGSGVNRSIDEHAGRGPVLSRNLGHNRSLSQVEMVGTSDRDLTKNIKAFYGAEPTPVSSTRGSAYERDVKRFYGAEPTPSSGMRGGMTSPSAAAVAGNSRHRRGASEQTNPITGAPMATPGAPIGLRAMR